MGQTIFERGGKETLFSSVGLSSAKLCQGEGVPTLSAQALQGTVHSKTNENKVDLYEIAKIRIKNSPDLRKI